MNDKERKLDELLDSALADYANVEPRAGLEGRILANLAIEPEKRTWLRWWPALGVAAAALIALVIFFQGPQTTKAPQVVVNTPTNNVPTPVPAPAVIQSRPAHVATYRGPLAHAPIRQTHTVPQTRTSAAPQLAVAKQDVFPAPSPLTAQEHLLLAYLRKTEPSEIAANSKPDTQPVFEQQINQVFPGQRNTDSNTNTR